jgi:hypothetical protein
MVAMRGGEGGVRQIPDELAQTFAPVLAVLDCRGWRVPQCGPERRHLAVVRVQLHRPGHALRVDQCPIDGRWPVRTENETHSLQRLDCLAEDAVKAKRSRRRISLQSPDLQGEFQ